MICSGVWRVRFMVESPAQSGRMRTLIHLGPKFWGHVNQGIDAYIATGRLPHGQPPPPKRGPLPRDADARTRMARKLRSKQGAVSCDD
jgi:hypothetical protein